VTGSWGDRTAVGVRTTTSSNTVSTTTERPPADEDATLTDGTVDDGTGDRTALDDTATDDAAAVACTALDGANSTGLPADTTVCGDRGDDAADAALLRSTLLRPVASPRGPAREDAGLCVADLGDALDVDVDVAAIALVDFAAAARPRALAGLSNSADSSDTTTASSPSDVPTPLVPSLSPPLAFTRANASRSAGRVLAARSFRAATAAAIGDREWYCCVGDGTIHVSRVLAVVVNTV
jgi:hypothetical protein